MTLDMNPHPDITGKGVRVFDAPWMEHLSMLQGSWAFVCLDSVSAWTHGNHTGEPWMSHRGAGIPCWKMLPLWCLQWNQHLNTLNRSNCLKVLGGGRLHTWGAGLHTGRRLHRGGVASRPQCRRSTSLRHCFLFWLILCHFCDKSCSALRTRHWCPSVQDSDVCFVVGRYADTVLSAVCLSKLSVSSGPWEGQTASGLETAAS